MTVICPNCKDMQMALINYQYSYKDGVPIFYLTKYYCKYCETTLGFSFPVSYARVVVK